MEGDNEKIGVQIPGLRRDAGGSGGVPFGGLRESN